ncbi:DNA-directed RNA polymerase 3, chloroplastic [Porphyridium purpureum]|uniref:DNA-directed RNA polymerase n=1 Tax=Porphyridium purpureum TaxID=35688 RepID=A0A5J4Z6R0_PORPP|nr:DNA-directed RNA polymerase 3, chloroplastic [Porphyridium purpureum]|eukprot:POR9165..scf295_1
MNHLLVPLMYGGTPGEHIQKQVVHEKESKEMGLKKEFKFRRQLFARGDIAGITRVAPLVQVWTDVLSVAVRDLQISINDNSFFEKFKIKRARSNGAQRAQSAYRLLADPLLPPELLALMTLRVVLAALARPGVVRLKDREFDAVPGKDFDSNGGGSADDEMAPFMSQIHGSDLQEVLSDVTGTQGGWKRMLYPREVEMLSFMRSTRLTNLATTLGTSVCGELAQRRSNRAEKPNPVAGVAFETDTPYKNFWRLGRKDPELNELLESPERSSALGAVLLQVCMDACMIETSSSEYLTPLEQEFNIYQFSLDSAKSSKAKKSSSTPEKTERAHGWAQETRSGESVLRPAWRRAYRWKVSRTGKIHESVLLAHPALSEALNMNESLREVAEFVRPIARPMLAPPKPWMSPAEGGYLKNRFFVMRARTVAQRDALWYSDISRICRALDGLGNQPWIINRPLFDIVEVLWRNGGGRAGLVNRANLPVPSSQMTRLWTEWREIPEAETEKRKAKVLDIFKHKEERLHAMKVNAERHSLRCDIEYKLTECRALLDEDCFYLPHSVDFRGRAYPLPTNLHHMSSDITRSLLHFKQKAVLGKRGLFWLKVHTANLMGMDKLTFEEREAYVDNEMPRILEAARDPLGKDRDSNVEYWIELEDPLQALGAMMELAKAARLGASYMHELESSLPVHQDGSCNGLQHYAALGGDVEGALKVNVLPSERPQDVYSAVADQVRAAVERDAQEGNELALLLRDKISRKVVKQTVMTSVYGVSLIGARRQIGNKLKEIDAVSAKDRPKAALYLAKHTLSGIGNIFRNATHIMEWLQSISHEITRTGNFVQWTTPLGLPVIQPYAKRAGGSAGNVKKNKTVLGALSLKSLNEDLGSGAEVDKRKNSTALPPNYVHSLDASHMMMTALECRKAGLAFASVHDSFWTHARDVDEMSRILREQFVLLHERPLLESLAESIRERHPDIVLPPVPPRGQLDLSQIHSSKYFFD